MKTKFLFTLIAILAFASLSFFAGHYLIEKTSDEKFCSKCHEWMSVAVKSYNTSIHGGNNKMGLKAKCADCHLPHDSMVSYIFQKAYNGIKEGTHMLFNDAKDKDWLANRENRQNYVYDSGCLKCHSNILNIVSKNALANDMHNQYKDKSKNLACVSCHKNVGHEDLGKILYEIKNPPLKD